jgi:hypothetical protein
MPRKTKRQKIGHHGAAMKQKIAEAKTENEVLAALDAEAERADDDHVLELERRLHAEDPDFTILFCDHEADESCELCQCCADASCSSCAQEEAAHEGMIVQLENGEKLVLRFADEVFLMKHLFLFLDKLRCSCVTHNFFYVLLICTSHMSPMSQARRNRKEKTKELRERYPGYGRAHSYKLARRDAFLEEQVTYTNA